MSLCQPSLTLLVNSWISYCSSLYMVLPLKNDLKLHLTKQAADHPLRDSFHEEHLSESIIQSEREHPQFPTTYPQGYYSQWYLSKAAERCRRNSRLRILWHIIQTKSSIRIAKAISVPNHAQTRLKQIQEISFIQEHYEFTQTSTLPKDVLLAIIQ